ncbi:unnamed protein product (macronuclear) [Paramecium tetraurelia]|uniref:Uncharacterized protein n=1 Tax=Paramecium tetraurelia TaxID=5888 RepID=A0BZN8_PARTE|nr:uncharacterized protein GSPATT00005857001 [Paramecium tetraurelia]CAK64005.1 unnamed protein product [Paramecium tetraurelia]|eukprot:XP_001431403.1 hypothetical protein (macronuclear) [Paramecium tetraurelia strain d4-2]
MNNYEVGIQRFIEKIREQIRLKEKEYLQIEKALIHKIVHKSPQPARTLELRPNHFLDVSIKPKHVKPKSNPNNQKTFDEIEPDVLPYLLQPLQTQNHTINKRISLKVPTSIPESSKKQERIENLQLRRFLRNCTPKKWTVESSDEVQI